MELTIVSVIGIVLVFALTILLAWSRAKNEPKPKRGSPPGKGHRLIHVNYESGAGGGHSTQYKVPRDPQDYAKAMVPKNKGNAT